MSEITSEELRENLNAVQKRIADAAQRGGRDAAEIRLISVSKTFPAETLQMAVAAGATDLGENRIQEAESKIAEIGRTAARWHLIGNLQANKARKAVRIFDVIQTLDSLELAQRLERICQEEGRENLEVLIQIDLAGETQKSGVSEQDLPQIVEFIQTARHLKLKGLMILPPFYNEAERVRPFFRRLREIRDELQKQNAFGESSGELSMGMSGDFEAAIEEGATLVRVGTAIFGRRGNPKSEI